jgi:hypothetical protein
MKLDDITIGEAKQLAKQLSCFNDQYAKSTTDGRQQSFPSKHPMIGKYCIARCYSAGVHAGTVEAIDGENVILSDSRRLWSWKANDGVALSGVAQSGLKSGSCKVDVVNPLIYLTGVCELIPVAVGVQESIHGYK